MALGSCARASRPSQRDVHGADEAFSQPLLANGLQVHPAREEGIDDPGVPPGAATGLEDLVDLRRREPLAIDAVARHGIERVGDGEDPGLEGDLLAREMIGISRPVQALMVVPHAGQDVVQLLQVSGGW